MNSVFISTERDEFFGSTNIEIIGHIVGNRGQLRDGIPQKLFPNFTRTPQDQVILDLNVPELSIRDPFIPIGVIVSGYIAIKNALGEGIK